MTIKLSNDAIILTTNGLKRIDELLPLDRVYDGCEFNTIQIKNIETSSVKKLSTNRGYNICGDFGVTIIDGRDRIKTNINNIKTNDKIISHKCMIMDTIRNDVLLTDFGCEYENHHNNKQIPHYLPKKITEELSYFLGYSYGDGYIDNKRYTISLACSDDYQEIIEKLKNIIKQEFGYDVKTKRGNGHWEILFIQLKTIWKFLKDNNIAKQKAGSLKLPKTVLQSNSKNFRAFFSGYFDADGYASGHKKGYCLCSIDYSVLFELQLYLSLNNIITTLRPEDRSKNGWNTLWSLHIYGGGSQKNAVEQFYQSCKISNKNFIGTKDFVKTPYIPLDFGIINPHNCRVAKKTDFVSFMTTQSLGNVDLQNEYINDVVKNEEVVTEVFELDVSNGMWANGFIINQQP